MSMRKLALGALIVSCFMMTRSSSATTHGQGGSTKPPNILVIMGDDVGWFNIGAYHRGMMVGKTPNLDKMAAAGMMFTDYYAEASCTADRANFITGEIPLRTGMTTVGQAGADVGIPDQAVTLATVSKRRDMRPASSARTISAIRISSCRVYTVLTSTSATSITSTPCPIHTGLIIRKTGLTRRGREI